MMQRLLAPLLVLAVMGPGACLAQVALDFRSASAPAFHTEGGAWAHDPAGGYGVRLFKPGAIAAASLAQPGFGGEPGRAQGFALSTTFTVRELGANYSNTVGLAALGSAPAFSGPQNSCYLADISLSGTLRILRIDPAGNVPLAIIELATVRLQPEGVYTLVLCGAYRDGDGDGANESLRLTASLFDGAGYAGEVSGLDPRPLTGAHFGYRLRSAAGGGGIDVVFSRFLLHSLPGR